MITCNWCNKQLISNWFDEYIKSYFVDLDELRAVIVVNPQTLKSVVVPLCPEHHKFVLTNQDIASMVFWEKFK